LENTKAKITLSDIPQVEHRPIDLDAVLHPDQAFWARSADVWAFCARVERDFWPRWQG